MTLGPQACLLCVPYVVRAADEPLPLVLPQPSGHPLTPWVWHSAADSLSAPFTCRGALLSLNPGTLGGALSPALMSNSTLATIQGQYSSAGGHRRAGALLEVTVGGRGAGGLDRPLM